MWNLHRAHPLQLEEDVRQSNLFVANGTVNDHSKRMTDASVYSPVNLYDR